MSSLRELRLDGRTTPVAARMLALDSCLADVAILHDDGRTTVARLLDGWTLSGGQEQMWLALCSMCGAMRSDFTLWQVAAWLDPVQSLVVVEAFALLMQVEVTVS